jgi:hypothetical protein
MMGDKMMGDTLEELGSPSRLDMIPDALLQEIAERVSCHGALAALSGTCKALRQILSTALIEQCIKAMIEARGWMPWPSQLSTRVARTVGTTISVLEYYALRVASLPLPHSSWPRSGLLGSARALRVGGAACHFVSLRAALESARDGDTLCLAAGIFDEGTLRVSTRFHLVPPRSPPKPNTVIMHNIAPQKWMHVIITRINWSVCCLHPRAVWKLSGAVDSNTSLRLVRLSCLSMKKMIFMWLFRLCYRVSSGSLVLGPLKDIPFFVRPFARKKIEKYAQDNSFSPITVEIYDQAKKMFNKKYDQMN